MKGKKEMNRDCVQAWAPPTLLSPTLSEDLLSAVIWGLNTFTCWEREKKKKQNATTQQEF